MKTEFIEGGYEQKMQSVGAAKETPRTSLEQAVKRLQQTAAQVSRLRDEMLGEADAEAVNNNTLGGGGFLGDVERAAREINRLADEIDTDAHAILKRF